MSEVKDISEKGKKAEDSLNSWFKNNKFSYISVCQNPKTFASLFKGNVKRPDFILSLEGIGLIAVDAKFIGKDRPKYKKGRLTVNYEEKKVIAFERIFRMPVWYVFMVEEDKGVWYWINSLKVLEIAEKETNNKIRKNLQKTKGALNEEDGVYWEFSRKDCVDIREAEDIAKLFAQRLPTLNKI